MAALKIYGKTTDTYNSPDRYDTWSLEIYPKSVRYGYYGGVDEWGYPRHYNEYYVGGKNLQALLDNFEVSTAKELVSKIAKDEDAIVDLVRTWIGNHCDRKDR